MSSMRAPDFPFYPCIFSVQPFMSDMSLPVVDGI